MVNTGGSSDPSTKVDNESTTGQANANEWGNAPAGPVDAFGFPLDSNQKRADTAAEAPPAEEPPAEATALEAPALEAPALEAPAHLPKLKNGYCVVVLTDPEGNPATIGSLRAVESPACMIRLGTLTENRETSLFLCARFPRLASDSNPSGEPFQRLWLNFYGDAFETFESDFVIAKVNEYKELPDKLTDRESVINALETGLYKLQLTYKPGKVVTKAVDGPDAFSMPESSHSAQLFRSLVECEMPTTLTLYFDHDPAPGDLVIDLMNKLRDRLQYEKDAEPSVEYRNKKGKIVIQYGKQIFPYAKESIFFGELAILPPD